MRWRHGEPSDPLGAIGDRNPTPITDDRRTSGDSLGAPGFGTPPFPAAQRGGSTSAITTRRAWEALTGGFPRTRVVLRLLVR